MQQIFVPEIVNDDDPYASAEGAGIGRKRRRAVSSREGEEVSSLYSEIIRPRERGSESRGITTSRTPDSGAAGDSRAWTNLSAMAEAPTTSRNCSGATRGNAKVVYGPAPNPHADARNKSATLRGFFCSVCGERVTSQTEEQHSTSTLHIFNQQHKPSERKVQLDESNRGFQLLSSMGWRLDEGLGARGQGRVDPLQTTFKRDTAGLGAGERLRPRVTHFPSHVLSQALNAPDGKSDAVRAQECLDYRRRGGGRRRYAGGVGQVTRSCLDESGGRSGVCRVENRVAASMGGGFWGKGVHPGKVPAAPASAAVAPTSNHDAQAHAGRIRPKGGHVSGRGVDSGAFISKRERRQRDEGKRRKEHKTRLELFSDVPEEFASLLFTG